MAPNAIFRKLKNYFLYFSTIIQAAYVLKGKTKHATIKNLWE
ncbi:MAG: hypothetical protein JETT_0672 [Candidatus Jettenia ecosi]|uniref:Uncharacterized protein n=1 Tax=Candidatus Jettenia ecosi TaxID=2494326 RepID=A0A533QEH8_9BACT|nr:MAG: hypothetical protein JETT_0672 [Candidatus Jettenia ecosi]